MLMPNTGSRKLEEIYDMLTDLLAHFQAVVDYPGGYRDLLGRNRSKIMEDAAFRLRS